MRFIPITYWSHGTFFSKRSPQKKINRNVNEGVYGNVLFIV